MIVKGNLNLGSSFAQLNSYLVSIVETAESFLAILFVASRSPNVRLNCVFEYCDVSRFIANENNFQILN